MNPNVSKLVMLGLSRGVAQKLVDAGLSTPALIRVASRKELRGAGLTGKDIATVRRIIGGE